jgi:hypothetical protein
MGNSDKYILGAIGALWGIVSKLLTAHAQNSRDRHEAEQAANPMLQTLYRLAKTPIGYKGTVELTTMQETIPLLWNINDEFCKFWALRVLNVLMSGSTLGRRDMEVEYVNKSIILKAGGAPMIQEFVSVLVDSGTKQADGQKPAMSDLILMVVSDILQSVLCSFHDTTSPENFAAFINALAQG